MIEVKEKEKCCGCTACYSVCPKEAITMQVDEEGFKYPIVDREKCVKCNLCEKVCPMLHQKTVNVGVSVKYAIQNKDADERNLSTAGGAFSLVADWILEEKKGIVFAVGFDGCTVLHKSAESKNQIEEMRGSKYVQSDLGSIFKKVLTQLEKGRFCLFVGTPCQVYGLFDYIEGLPCKENLLTMDLMCLGVSSPKLYEMWVSFLEKKYKAKVDRIFFRDKSYGYATANVRIELGGKVIEQKYDSKSLMKTFFSGYNMRPSCYDCSFRCVDRVSDFTIGDFHQIGQYCKDMDDDKGTTCLWIHTEMGRKVFDLLKDRMDYLVLETSCSSTLDSVSKKTKLPENRDIFWRDVNNMEYEEFCKHWAKNDLKAMTANMIKPIINKLPIRSMFFKAIKKWKQRNFEKRVDNASKK
ncbi:MAG: Coenzyme F420 hydrogenase/dehydrogenase, beta subunit C-terminal domain [Gallintestinimicrobium sp.]|uniref:Coenzyme F420 hydrogenase/dehydrogenase, beta subunit C-terminal domain n=1 Tax=Gallintestinimicrobium sp. TaxID=2981655 RepID=UPI003995CA5D